MFEFCTIITPDFVPFAKALHKRLNDLSAPVRLHVLVMGDALESSAEEAIVFYHPDELASPFTEALLKKYAHTSDALRWSLKPVFLLHLLNKFERVVYADCDLCFFADFRFLFDQLDSASLLLTPHWAPENPFEQEEKFRINFLIGLYNAGFVGASRRGIKSLEWWATACLYKTADETANGFFVDQRYLDLLPILDPLVAIVRHQGCNVGSWNIESCRRVQQPGGRVLINGRDEIVFIHFNPETIRQILQGNDPLLNPYLQQYEKGFADQGYNLQQFLPALAAWKKTNAAVEVKRNISLRSRVKRFLFKLAARL